MHAGQDALAKARTEYEEHVRTCRTCAGRGFMCQASKILRRTYNNLVRAAGPGPDGPAADAEGVSR